VARDDVRGRWSSGEHELVLPGEPSTAYQPIVDLATGGLLGFEALLRWRHPTEGVIFPEILIPWAEANGDIVALGDWVLAEACQQAARWTTSLQLAVNCSLVQLRRRTVVASVRSALDGSGLAPDRLTIEVSEHAVSDEEAAEEISAISSLGVQLAVDDVGTSWSSFEHLRRLEVNTVKIDSSFVGGLETDEGINRMVVETLVSLVHSSGMSTVAEGVENAAQASIVREFASDAAQGYFFAPPLDAENAFGMAGVRGLRFPLDGIGWQEDDDWPFAGARAEHPFPQGRTTPLPAGKPTDAIGFVELALAGGSAGTDPEPDPTAVAASRPGLAAVVPPVSPPEANGSVPHTC